MAVWKSRRERADFRPARVILSRGDFKYDTGNVLVFEVLDDERLNIPSIVDRKKGLLKEGQIKAGEKFDVGWMIFNCVCSSTFQSKRASLLPQSRKGFGIYNLRF